MLFLNFRLILKFPDISCILVSPVCSCVAKNFAGGGSFLFQFQQNKQKNGFNCNGFIQ